MKHLNYILVFIISTIVFACSESANDTTLTVDRMSVTISADGGTEIIHISSNSSWNIICDNSDITISPMSGNGDADVRITMQESWNLKDITSRLTISTSDGVEIKNITITQKTKFTNGLVLKINNHVSGTAILDGTAHAVDSLIILSNTPWQLKGPDWIEVYNGSRWVALSESRATINSDNNKLGQECTVLFRASTKNDSENAREGKIILTPMYEGDITEEKAVCQLGKYTVMPDRVLPMCNSFACGWKYGSAVSIFYIQAAQEEFTDSELTDSFIREWSSCSIEYLGSCGNLKEGTTYYLYIASVDNSGKYHIYHYQISTKNSESQPMAIIENVKFDGDWLEWNTKMTNDCASYFQIILTNLLSNYDAAVAWYLYYTAENISRYMESGSFGLHTNHQDAQIITWGIKSSTNMLSSVLGRHVTSFYKTSTTRNSLETPITKKVDLEEIKNSIISIELK